MCESRLQRDRREGVPKQVVQVAGDARALVVGRESSDLRACLGEGDVLSVDLRDGVGNDADDGDRERGDVVEGLGEAVMP